MGKKVKLDMTGVESFQKASEGRHTAKIISAIQKESQGGNDMIQVTFEITKGEDKGSRVMENYPLTDTALWKLKGLLQAIGMKADGKMVLDLDKLIGKMLTIEVIHEEYNGVLRAKIAECRKLEESKSDDEDYDDDEDEDEDDEEEEEEEAPKKKPAKKAPAKETPKSKKKPAPEPDEDDEDEDDDWDEDEDEDEEEEEAPPKKKASKKPEPKKASKKEPAKKSSKKKPEPEDDDDDDDEEDWEDA